MRTSATVSALLSALFAVSASARPQHSDCKGLDTSIIQHTGISKGVEEIHSGSK